METLTVRIYTEENNYKSSRQIKIDVEELRMLIKEDYLKPDEILISLDLEEIKT